MAIKTRFFSGIYYGQDDFKKMIKDGLSSGYVIGEGGQLAVTADGSALQVTVATGRAYLNGYSVDVQDSAETLTVQASSGSQRLDRVVLHLDENTGITLIVKKGGAAAPPALTRAGSVYEISLAQIRVRAGAGNIQQSDITDERGNPAVCGIVGPHVGTLPLASTSQVGGVQVDTSNGLTISNAGVLGYDGVARTIYIDVGDDTAPSKETVVGTISGGGTRVSDSSVHEATRNQHAYYNVSVSIAPEPTAKLYSGLVANRVRARPPVVMCKTQITSQSGSGFLIIGRTEGGREILAKEIKQDTQGTVKISLPADWDFDTDKLYIGLWPYQEYGVITVQMLPDAPEERLAYWQYPEGTEVPVIQQPVSQIDIDQDDLIAEIIDADNQAPAAGSYTAIGKLHARLIHAGKRNWPGDIPAGYQAETYDAYTNYYQYEPALEPVPNEQSELPVE